MKTSILLVLLFLSCVSCSKKKEEGSLSSGSQKVLIVVANNGFYYQEYADPRAAIEAAGHTVVVAAGTTSTAIPHANTGQPSGVSGNITPDVALADVDTSEYSALVIVGGWGATHYYYAYSGSIDDSTWAPNATYAGQMNQIINEFISSGKYILGVCNGVNVLSWARVSGVSPLSGKNVTAPRLYAPAQTYNSVHYNDNSLRFDVFPADNGATVAAQNSIGDTSSDQDDVAIDGQILTAQDNNAALAGGAALAALLD